MAVIPLNNLGLPGQSVISQQNCSFDAVVLNGAITGNTFTYTLKGEMFSTAPPSIIGLPPGYAPVISNGVLTITPDATAAAATGLVFFIIYKK